MFWVLLSHLFLTGQYHGAVTNTYQSSFQWRRQRTARIVIFMTIASRVDAENVHQNDRQAYDKRQCRPKHTVHDGGLRHHIQDHVAWVAGVGEADILRAWNTVRLCKTLHCLHVLLDDTIALVKRALCTQQAQYMHQKLKSAKLMKILQNPNLTLTSKKTFWIFTSILIKILSTITYTR